MKNMMKKGSMRGNGQQAAFELKHRTVVALNKLADRDTYQIAVDDLEKFIECLPPNGIAPFLSCILDTDSEQKSAVRKECIRLIGILASLHDNLIGPHLSKMMTSIVKRLKDSDSSVRDACVETVGVLAAKLGRAGSDNENDGIFVALVRPLFEALGEQNKQVQAGSALCLARVIDNIQNPSTSVLQKMLARTVKLLKNPHFMAKPAVIELNRSIIQAGGAPSLNLLSSAIMSLQDALKNSDWATRKSACAALGEIASSGGSVYGSFKTSCIRSLESCRFDKVKPVRDTALQALHLWKSLRVSDTHEPSETGSSIKENLYKDDFGDATSVSDSISKDATPKKFGHDVKSRLPHSYRKPGQNHPEKLQYSRANDWHIEIALPRRNNNIFALEAQNPVPDCSSVTKTIEKRSDVTCSHDVEYEYVHIDDKQECSSVSNPFPSNFHAKEVSSSHFVLDEVSMDTSTITNEQCSGGAMTIKEQSHLSRTQDRRSLDSTTTKSIPNMMHGCDVNIANEIISIQKHLIMIQDTQASFEDLLKEVTTNIVDTLSVVQMKVSGLEDRVDRMAQELALDRKCSDPMTTRLIKRSPAVASPRFSTCTPRPSVDICHRQEPSLPSKDTKVWAEKEVIKSRPSRASKQSQDIWMNIASAKPNKNPLGTTTTQRSSARGAHGCQTRETDKQNIIEIENSMWNVVKGHLLNGDLDSAYLEALCSGNELILFQLLDRTGPVLENISQKTACDLLTILASYFLEQRFVNSILPWLQQVAELCTTRGSDYLILSSKTRREILSAFQQVINMEFSSVTDRRAVMQLAFDLRQTWEQCSV
ncbi:hypothetical protein DM860_005603 [Cuscuta australis]|uniref:TOG domain-containing protein n=1 Tax=Cuscuta australis TaxID=267555 RepID=A0A328DUU6_9ASTE|nr:hypothetical protein DM860_005603 [Cuscuta australis]